MHGMFVQFPAKRCGNPHPSRLTAGEGDLPESVSRFQQSGQGFVGFFVGEQLREPFVDDQRFQAQIQAALVYLSPELAPAH